MTTTPQYNPDPSVPVVASGELLHGYDSLAHEIHQNAIKAKRQSPKVIIVDIYHAPDTNNFHTQLREAWSRLTPSATSIWIDTKAALKTEAEMDQAAAPFSSFDPVFGKTCENSMRIFFDDDKWKVLVRRVQSELVNPMNDFVIIFGPGAMLSPLRAYSDCAVSTICPREFIFFASESNTIHNICDSDGRDRGKWPRYQRSFFVDWPVQMRHIASCVDAAEFIVDISNTQCPSFMRSAVLLESLKATSQQPFRVRSLFYPGVWGGQRLKELVEGLPRDWVNTAWGFELIFPENTLTLKSQSASTKEPNSNQPHGEIMFRLPFELMMELQLAKNILGADGHRRFGSFFPIRLDFLDTMGGTNLSCQVHPPDDYISSHFGEPFAQHESYYIMEAQDNAKAYLGLTDSTSKESFLHDVQTAVEKSTPFNIAKHVNEVESKRGDLFMIPAGTVHCSGSGNLVLEVSATPWIYTFKIYDYLRTDLDGNPRPISYHRAFEVIDFSRKTEWTEQNLVRKPKLIHSDPKNHFNHYVLSDLPLVFFRIERIEFDRDAQKTSTFKCDDMNGSVHVICCTFGNGCEIRGAGLNLTVAYAETVIIPESCKSYEISPLPCITPQCNPVEVIRVFCHEDYTPRHYARPNEMTKQPIAIGLDVGGSSIKSGIVCRDVTGRIDVLHHQLNSTPIDNSLSKDSLMDTFADIISNEVKRVNLMADSTQLRTGPWMMDNVGVGLCMPGPMDYPNGIVGDLSGLGKFKHLKDVNVRDELASRLNWAPEKILFCNDAEAAAVGEVQLLPSDIKNQKFIYVGLGTGCGSAFLENGKAASGENVPPNGWLYCFDSGVNGLIADDVFSTRGLGGSLIAGEIGVDITDDAQRIANAGQLAINGDQRVIEVLNEFGSRLGSYLLRFVKSFQPHSVIVGGGIANLFKFFGPQIQDRLRAECLVTLAPSVIENRSAAMGAVVGAGSLFTL